MQYTSPNSLIISATRVCRPSYQTQSSMALCKDHAIPSLNITSVWLCITLFTSKTMCSNETSPFMVGSSLKALNFDIHPLPMRLHWGGNSHAVALALVLLSAYLHLLPEHFLPFLPIIIPLPTSSVLVWQCHIQCAHFDPTILQ